METSDPNARKDLKSASSEAIGTKQWGHGMLIRTLDDEQWFSGTSKEGRAILDEVYQTNENGEYPSYYHPQ